MCWTNEDADKYFDEQEERLNKRPVCECCGNHIQDEGAALIPDYGFLCTDCFDGHFKFFI